MLNMVGRRQRDMVLEIRRHVHATHIRAKPAPGAQPDERRKNPALATAAHPAAKLYPALSQVCNYPN